MPQCFSQRIRRLSAVISAGFLLLAAVSPLLARPSAMKLFPEETLLLVRTPNAGELFDRLRDTATGRMVRDPQVAPLVERLYGSAGDLYTQKVAEWLGVSWEELQDLPRAEVAFAIVARRDHLPAFVLLVDQGETPGVAKRMLDAALTRIQEDGGEMTKETIAGQEITVVREGDNQDHTVGIFEREQTIVAATDPGLIREILQHWNSDDGGAPVVSEESTPEAETATADAEPPTDAAEEDSSASEPRQYSGQTLARNNKFVTILRHCRRTHDPPPNLMFFVDPIGLVRQFNRDNAGMAIAMATFPALGVDGLAGIGSTMAFSAGRYDSLAHLHVLLDNPRSGVMQVIALEASDGAPPAWVFADLESYFSWRWNVRTSFEVIRSLVDRFQYEGRTDKFIAESINEKQGIDFEKEIIDNAEGRFERLEERKFGDITYYPFVIEWPEELQEDPPSTPFVAVMDGYFFIGGSCQLFERAIGARDGTVDRLSDAPEFVQLAAEVQQEAPGVTPALWFYSRYEESLRQWYGLLTNEKTKAYLEEHAEGNPFFAALADTLAADELPPFEAVAQYAMPSVGVIYDTDTGFHGIMFSVAKDPQPTAE
jgi:hypothetical protein